MEDLSANERLAGSMADAAERLHREYFTPELGFGAIKRINFIDGVRIIFDNNDVSHLRPSGNAPEFRNYATADTEETTTAPPR